MKTCSTLPLFFATWCAVSVHADVINLGADKDTAIVEGFGGNGNENNSNGSGPLFFAGGDGNGARHRALISFDFSLIPAGATITNVQLTLTLGQIAAGGASSATIGLYDLKQNWTEGSLSSVSTSASVLNGAGQGVAATSLDGGATWNAATYPGAAWTPPGGNYDATARASLFLSNNTVGNSFTWLSTQQLIDDVQGWHDNPTTNFGWEVIQPGAAESTKKTIYGFYSSEWHSYTQSGANGASQEPVLQVTYNVAPEPAVGTLAAMAALSLLSTRRLRRRV